MIEGIYTLSPESFQGKYVVWLEDNLKGYTTRVFTTDQTCMDWFLK